MEEHTKPRRWTDAEDDKLIELYETLKAKEVADQLNRPVGNVYSRIAYLRRKGREVIHKHYGEDTLFEVYKGTEVIAAGTMLEIAEKLSVSTTMVTDWATPSRVARGNRPGSAAKWAIVTRK